MQEVKMGYEDWERIYNNNLRKQRAERRYFLRQRLAGLALIVTGIASIFIEYDITYCLAVVPLGLYVMFTKQKVMSIIE